MDTRGVFEALVAVIANYREIAIKAVKEKEGKLYVPGYFTFEDFLTAVDRPSRMTQSGGNQGEPAYLNLGDGLRGRNGDGSKHSGFIVIDVIDREVLAIVDPEGVPSFGSIDPRNQVFAGRWSGWEVSVTLPTGEEIRFESGIGIRGSCLLPVRFHEGKWSATSDGHPLTITKTT